MVNLIIEITSIIKISVVFIINLYIRDMDLGQVPGSSSWKVVEMPSGSFTPDAGLL